MIPAQPSETKQPKSKKHRSPGYPAINIEDALARARAFYGQERRNAASFLTASGHWGFKATSSGALTTVAALKSFGLMRDVDDDGGGSGRVIQLTDLALRILLDAREPSAERDAAIKQAALSPKIHKELWKKWGLDLPSDSELRHQLIFNWKFNENSVADFIDEYKATVKFANLTAADTISSGPEDKTEPDEETEVLETERSNRTAEQPVPPTIKVGSKPRDAVTLLSQALAVSIPRNFRVDINVHGDELRREDLTKIKSQFNRWIEGLEEAFDD